jgi:small ligand-binding sensory domain FIST
MGQSEPSNATDAAATFAGAAALSGHLDPRVAAEQVCDQVMEALGGGPVDLALLFASGTHARMMERIGDHVRAGLEPRTMLGATAEGVLAGETELGPEETGLSLLALRLPGVALSEFTSDDLPAFGDEPAEEQIAALAEAIGADPWSRAALLFGDPFSTPLLKLLPAMARVHEPADMPRALPVFGGMASAGEKPGRNTLLLGSSARRTGAVGVTIGGPVTIDWVVSQGCRPIGEPMVITGARRNIVFTLGGRPAVEAIREAIEEIPERERALLRNGMFLGRAVSEYKDRFGRGDFLIRAVMGADEKQGAIAVGDIMKVGQTVQLHVRDASTASEDLELLMSAQSFQAPPIGALVCTCNGRGTRLFEEPNHDAMRIARALGPGASAAVAGFFAAGEIGPIGPESFLHGHTASVAIFREGAPPPTG